MSIQQTTLPQTEGRTPRQDGFAMPGRWVEHARTFVSWPCCEWPAAPGHLQDARDEWAEVIRTITRFEPVTVIANPGSRDQVLEACGSSVDVAEIPIDDCWIRDNGPIFVVDGDGTVAMTHFGFNAWGGKAAAVGQRRGRRRAAVRAAGACAGTAAPIIAEGGGIACDGEGTVITTESVLLNPNRNPGLGKAEIEAVLRDYLGAEKVIWLPYGLAEDSGRRRHRRPLRQRDPVHPSRAWHCSRRRPTGRTRTGSWPRANRAAARAGADRRAGPAARDRRDASLPVLHPRGRGRAAGRPLHQLLPGQRRHHRAAAGRSRRTRSPTGMLADLFPGREVVGVPTDFQAYGGGGIGCITQQLPAGRVAPAGDHA